MPTEAIEVNGQEPDVEAFGSNLRNRSAKSAANPVAEADADDKPKPVAKKNFKLLGAIPLLLLLAGIAAGIYYLVSGSDSSAVEATTIQTEARDAVLQSPGPTSTVSDAPTGPVDRETPDAFSSCGLGRRMVVLTFDDGPNGDPTASETLLNELASSGVPATFYTSLWADGGTVQNKRALVERMWAEGHTVHSHSFEHPNFSTLDDEDVRSQLNAQSDFLGTAGALPTQFRPPFGVLSEHQATIAQELGYSIAMWNIEPADFDATTTTDLIVDRVIDAMENGVGLGNSAVILLHDIQYHRFHGLVARLVEYFHANQYTFVTADTCLAACGNRSACRGNVGPTAWQGVFVP